MFISRFIKNFSFIRYSFVFCLLLSFCAVSSESSGTGTCTTENQTYKGCKLMLCPNGSMCFKCENLMGQFLNKNLVE